MRIGNLLISTAKTVRDGLVDMAIEGDSNFDKILQIYQCRVLGLCITRDLESDTNLEIAIKKEAEKITYLKKHGLD